MYLIPNKVIFFVCEIKREPHIDSFLKIITSLADTDFQVNNVTSQLCIDLSDSLTLFVSKLTPYLSIVGP